MRFLAAVTIVVLSLISSNVRAEDAKVTVVAILASDRHKNVDPKLQAIAAEIKAKDPALTGFRVERTTAKTVAYGKKESFPLLNDLTAEITAVSYDAKADRIQLTVKAPKSGEITYSTAPGKFFPIQTKHQTEADKEWLIIAVMANRTDAKK